MVRFNEYIGQYRSQSSEISHDLIRKYIEKYSIVDSIFTSGPTVPYLLDLSTLRYPYISNSAANILGIPVTDFLEKGVETLFNQMHPEDIHVMHTSIIPGFSKIKRSRPVSQAKQLRFSFNYRFQHPKRGYIQCHEKVQVLETDTSGKPLLIFGSITDISEYKQDHSIVATVSILNKAQEYETIYVKNFGLNNQHIFTNREMDIVRLLAKGLSSKDIAEKLYISSKTVDKHRRNILHKYSKKNTRELIHYALQQGWL